jgi:hypothetical protein
MLASFGAASSRLAAASVDGNLDTGVQFIGSA